MKLILVLFVMALVVNTAWTKAITAEDDWSKHTAVDAASTLADEDFELDGNVGPSVTEMMEEEEEEVITTTTTTTAATTKKSSVRKPNRKDTTTTVKPVVVVAEAVTPEPTQKPKSNRKPTVSTRSRTGPRGQPASKIEELPVEEEMVSKPTSPASVDTASGAVKAPKNFKPTAKPVEEEAPKDLVDFLRRRKIERIQATTTVDPFIAILATATPPSTTESVTFAVDKSSSSGRFSSRGSSRTATSPSSSSRRSGGVRKTMASPTTTEAAVAAPVAEAPRNTINRFASSRKSFKTTAATTTAQPTIDAPAVESSSTRPRLIPKRPADFRPIGNSISRRRDQTTTTTTEAPATAILPEEEELEDVEATTRRSFRRASGRLVLRSNGI